AVPRLAEDARRAGHDVGDAELDFSVALPRASRTVEEEARPVAREERVPVLDVEALRDHARAPVLRVDEADRVVVEPIVREVALDGGDPRARVRERPCEIARVLLLCVRREIAAVFPALVVRDDVRLGAPDPVIPMTHRARAIAVEEIARSALFEILRARSLIGVGDAWEDVRDDGEHVAPL